MKIKNSKEEEVLVCLSKNIKTVETINYHVSLFKFVYFVLFLGGIVVGFAFWICVAYGSDTTALKMPAQYSVILLGGISGKNFCAVFGRYFLLIHPIDKIKFHTKNQAVSMTLKITVTRIDLCKY